MNQEDCSHESMDESTSPLLSVDRRPRAICEHRALVAHLHNNVIVLLRDMIGHLYDTLGVLVYEHDKLLSDDGACT